MIGGFLFAYNFRPKSRLYFALNAVQNRSAKFDPDNRLLPNRLHMVNWVSVVKLKYLFYFQAASRSRPACSVLQILIKQQGGRSGSQQVTFPARQIPAQPDRAIIDYLDRSQLPATAADKVA